MVKIITTEYIYNAMDENECEVARQKEFDFIKNDIDYRKSTTSEFIILSRREMVHNI